MQLHGSNYSEGTYQPTSNFSRTSKYMSHGFECWQPPDIHASHSPRRHHCAQPTRTLRLKAPKHAVDPKQSLRFLLQKPWILRISTLWTRRAKPTPRGSKYPRFKDSGPKNHSLNGIWNQSPEILGTWTLGAPHKEA